MPVDGEFLGETMDRQRGETGVRRVAIGEIVAGVILIATAGQGQPAVGPAAGQERRREAGVRQRKSDADVTSVAVSVGGVDADVDGLVGIGERADGQASGAARASDTIGNIWYGSKGYMATGAGGWRTFMGPEQAPGPKSEAGAGVGGFVNFIDVVRSRKREDQLSEIEEGSISTMLIHLANISYRTGRTLYFDPVTYTCKGDAEATAMFTREQYRAPFVVPKIA